MSKVLLLADHVQTAVLGARLQIGAAAQGDTIVAISARLSAVIKGRKMGMRSLLVKKEGLPPNVIDKYHEHTFEVRTGYLTRQNARILHDSIVAAALNLIRKDRPSWSFVLAWNGALVSSRAAETISATLGIPVLYMEIANISGRMVFDPSGSNADASVARNPQLLDKYSITEEVFDQWSTEYVEIKRSQRTIPQVKTFVKPNVSYLIDYLGTIIGAAPAFSVGPFNRAANIIRKKLWNGKLRKITLNVLPSEPFLFLPLQVSTDTNMVVRSQIDNEMAIEIAISKARQLGWKVVAKVHPAEREGLFLKNLYKNITRRRFDIILVDVITAECISRAEHVMTINSTVGFESRMLGTEVTVLQPALYSHWSIRQMAQFALKYTIAFDMYSNDEATKQQWNEILLRLPKS